ncbi:hypothetical protein ACFLV7_05840 [Chloroflexota bacterium]
MSLQKAAHPGRWAPSGEHPGVHSLRLLPAVSAPLNKFGTRRAGYAIRSAAS